VIRRADGGGKLIEPEEHGLSVSVPGTAGEDVQLVVTRGLGG
jgi:hypothetical protein